ncbi:MAG: tetratricopeptide repeat protein [Chitinophagaceae bacterium]|nr:tetratricopeptide repeat protein [Chitinophagaceae bacterium]
MMPVIPETWEGVEGVAQTASALASSWGKEYKILSCQPNQLSLESSEWGGGRGLFSLQLEEGMKGLADKNNDGKVSFSELQRYITDNVATYSEEKQIPVVSGDLSKSFIKVDPKTLAVLKKQKAENYPMLAVANTKGNEEKYVDSLDPAGKKIYLSFKKNLVDKKLIWPKDTNALRDYKAFIKKYKDNPLIATMRRTMAASLNDRFNGIVGPLLKDETSYSTKDECFMAAAELDSCLHLLGEQHYMYSNLKARKLFMDAMALTWALSETEYNISLKPKVEQSISYLEQSEELEPNAAYTVSALGTRYFFIYEYDKAFAKFQKYLDLRPNDFYSKYSLGIVYRKLKQFDKSEELFKKLIEEKPDMAFLYSQLFDTYYKDGKYAEALAVARKITDSVDVLTGLFATGVYYSQQGNMDSAVYYYQLAKSTADCNICDNNIGVMYFVNNKIDSARKYFNLARSLDTTNAFPIFNLATIDAVKGDYRTAINGFAKSIDYAPAFTEAFVTHFDLYLNKHYTVTDSSLYREFRDKAFQYDLQYLGYLSVLYCFMRDSILINSTKAFDYIFPELFNFKDESVFTWYHHACYKAVIADKKTALESLEKSLKLGFGTYFMLTSDDDLASIRNEPEFKALLIKYFPAEVKKYKQ